MFKEAVVLLAIQALVVSSDSVCPDRDVCEDEHTCCQGPTGEYSCCPHHQGECCDDHLFCCPEHTVCLMEDEHPRCVNATIDMPRTERIASRQSSLLKSLRVISASPEIKDAVVCPDKSFCPAEFSCVKLPITFGCCPITQGIVCADGKHCCPEGLECSSDGKSCVQPQEPVVAVICSDGKSECPQGASCCQSSDGLWGCCPFPRAVCCDDDEHCCPKDSTCDVKNSKCISSTNQHMPMWAKFPARLRADWEDHTESETSSQPEAVMARNVPCDDKVACADGNTCCKTTAGDWACCPIPKAVCCDDHLSCCPEGTTCDTAAGSCLSPTGPVPMMKKLAALLLPPKENDVICDSTASCPDGNTCCKDPQGQWGCCPLPEAVCCDDHESCCPKGTTCDTAAGSCLSPAGPVPMMKKLAATAVHSEVKEVPLKVECDSTTSCPDHTTCCFMKKENQWGCCPFPNALCCEDGEHCCPSDYKCNTDTTTCTRGDTTIPWYNKLPAQSSAMPSEAITTVTCDSDNSCPSGSSCCQLSNGKWGCCPLTEAVCCSDQAHCCPRGYTCNLEAGSCEMSVLFQAQMLPLIRLVEQEPEMPDTLQEDDLEMQCDAQVSCHDQETCCMADGGWGCCPAPKATCCADMKHCCPAGYACGEGGTCIQATRFHKDNWQVFFSKKKRALVY